MKTLFLLICAIPLLAADGTVYVLQADKNVVSVLDAGSLGIPQTITLPAPPSGGHNKIWFSASSAFPQKGSESNCGQDPCQVLFNTELGRYGYMHAAYNSSDVQVGATSSWELVPFTPPAVETSAYSMPAQMLGFRDFTRTYQFSIGGASVSNLRIWLYASNCRQGTCAVLGNTGVEHIPYTVPIVQTTCVGSTHVCTFTTDRPHHLVNGTVQLNFFHDNYPAYDGALNDYFTATVTGATTFTVLCPSITVSGDYNSGVNGTPVGKNYGKTVSQAVYYTDETRFFGSIDTKIQANHLMFPAAPGEFTANATNTVSLRFKGQDSLSVQTWGLQHGFYALGFNVVQPDVDCTGAVAISGSSATLTCNSHGYSDGDTILVQNAPGAQWMFNGMNVITSHTTNTITFTWGSNIEGGGTAGVSPYTIPASVGSSWPVPTVTDTTVTPQPVIKVARCLIAKSAFDFTGYTNGAFPSYSGDAANGALLFAGTGLTLKDPTPQAAPSGTTAASCASCHYADGSDLKRFGFGSLSIKVAAMHRGATEGQANDIVEFIRNIPVTTPALGRPWNPPYQPAPGLDSKTVDEWTAGGGLQWHLTYDADMAHYLHPANDYSTWAVNGTVNTREIPVPIQLPPWRVWLPETYPGDFCTRTLGCTFSSTLLSQEYASGLSLSKVPQALASGVNNSATTFTTSVAQACTNNDYLVCDEGSNREFVQVTAGCGTTSLTVVRGRTIQGVATSGVSHSAGVSCSDYTGASGHSGNTDNGFFGGIYSPGIASVYPSFIGFDQYFMKTLHLNTETGGAISPSTYMNPDSYGAVKWANLKTSELFVTRKLQEIGDISVRAMRGVTSIDARSGAQTKRGQFNSLVFCMGPHKCVDGGPVFGNAGGVFSERNFCVHDSAWYYLSGILTNDNRLSLAGGAIDWQYFYGYNSCLSNYRAGFFNMAGIWAAISTQQSMGNAILGDSVSNGMSLSGINQIGKTFDFQLSGLMTNQTDTAALVSQVASMVATTSAFFTTTEWQNYFLGTFGTGCPNATAPVPGNVRDGSTACAQDNVAYLLTFASYYGASGGTLSTIKTWANAVFAPHDFQADIDAGPGCVFADTPSRLSCSTF